MRVGAGLRGAAQALPGLLGLHPRHQHKAVGEVAAEIAGTLGEPGRFKQWCREIYRALHAENELRSGLSVLREALLRLDADLREAPGVWRRPGAVLAARLKPA